MRKSTSSDDDDDDDSIYGAGGKALPDDEITMDDDLPNGKDVDADEAADAGFEIQDEDDVFGLLNDSYNPWTPMPIRRMNKKEAAIQ